MKRWGLVALTTIAGLWLAGCVVDTDNNQSGDLQTQDTMGTDVGDMPADNGIVPDSGGRTDLEPPPDAGPCLGANPQGCMDSGCPAGQQCVPTSGRCIPSFCSCDEESAQWICTDDCGGGLCLPESSCLSDADCAFGAQWCEAGVCIACGDAGSGCDVTPCPPGYHVPERNGCPTCSCEPDLVCWSDSDCAYGSQWCEDGQCVPCDNSGAVCDMVCQPGYHMPERNGCSSCTCVPDGGCWSDEECAYGAEWCENGICVPCDNGGFACEIDCAPGYHMPERNGCAPCTCVPWDECRVDADCPDGSICTPSACEPTCTPDDPLCCGGNVCTPEAVECPGENPQGCVSTGCPDGEQCMPTSGVCISSGCTCDPATARWVCTPDCNGGICVPLTGCLDDAQCQFGAEWCEDGACIPCDNSGSDCLLACPEGTHMPERNGCIACECVPDGNCTSDDQCIYGAEWCMDGWCGPCDNSGAFCDMMCEPGYHMPERNGCVSCECVPDSGGCTSDDECMAGAEWCVDGVCVPCDNSGMFCDMMCPPGFHMPERNGCVSCTCVPDERCWSDTDCGYGQQWCEEGACVPCDNSGMVCDIACPQGFHMPQRNGCTPCTCVPDEGCFSDSDCAFATEWCEQGACVPCDNSGLLCDLACRPGSRMPERNGCYPCTCVPYDECQSDQDCQDGAVCQPGSCSPDCDPAVPMCCVGNACIWPQPPTCPGENPQGCAATGCPVGEVCTPTSGVCIPSACTCDEQTGQWLCTADCDGGICLPSLSCTSDADCAYGEQWCQDGQCVACDNSAMYCDIDCGDGFDLAERNGCTPCQCVLANACTSHTDCETGFCQAGPICYPWCAFDDPTCCFGNVCAATPLPCDSPNPQACTDTGCPPGLSCQALPLPMCMSSSCVCDPDANAWQCTDDCVSGVCVAEPLPIW